jgi:endonuclease/exonuclease/phosphatase family metal-dependent hydrolase
LLAARHRCLHEKRMNLLRMQASACGRLFALLLCWGSGDAMSAAAESLRIATYNSSLNDDAGQLIARLEAGDPRASDAAAILQRVRPDIVLINEFDRDPEGRAATLFHDRYLARSQAGDPALDYPYRHAGEVNTGVASGLDINGDGETQGPNDAWGFGHHPGQFGMLLLSRYPLDRSRLREFRSLRWSRLPGALRPQHPDGRAFHPDPVWKALRLSSKAHWDIPVLTPLGAIHVLASHPTPPVFDGPENLNGRRNFDELRLWKYYLDADEQPWLCDEQGRCGGLPPTSAFVILGDLNADPTDGDTLPGAVQQVLEHPRVLRYPAPRSEGAAAAAGPDPGPAKRGDPATHTAAFTRRTGNLRVDFVLPSVELEVVGSGVFWPTQDQAEARWLESSDHRLVWVDVRRRHSEPAPGR